MDGQPPPPPRLGGGPPRTRDRPQGEPRAGPEIAQVWRLGVDGDAEEGGPVVVVVAWVGFRFPAAKVDGAGGLVCGGVSFWGGSLGGCTYIYVSNVIY